MKPVRSCNCFHMDREHVKKIGRCKGKDSYSLPCACPSFEQDPNDVEEDEEISEYKRIMATEEE